MGLNGLFKRRDRASEALCALLALLIGALAAAPLLLGSGMVYTRAGGDSPFLLQRVQQLALALGEGVFPVRWMPDANLGLGYPAFNYYAALPYYVAAALHLAGLGLIAAIQITQLLGFLMGGLSAYALGRALKLRPPGALTASAFFTLAPFHLVNVYVRGDSLSEFWAMGLAALCLYAVIRLRERPGPGGVALLAASYAALVLAHNITALLASPVLALALLAAGWTDERRWRVLAAGAGALALGLVLSAWFWVPALAERDLVQLGQQTTGYFDFRGHFRGADLVQGSLLHDYDIAADADPFCMGLVQAALMLAGLVAAGARIARRMEPGAWLACAICAVGATVLITPLSLPLWERLPLLHYAQFPWRLLGLQAVLAAPMVGLLAETGSRDWLRWLLAASLVLLVGVSSLGALRPDRLPLNEADITPERLMLFEAFSGNVGGTVRAEYLPAQAAPRYYTSPQLLDRDLASPPWAASGGDIHASLVERGTDRQVWQVETSAAERIVFPTVFFPGWQAAVDGRDQAVLALEGLGLIAVDVPAGSHLVALRFGPTPVRRAAELGSLVGGIATVGLLVWWALGYPGQLHLESVVTRTGMKCPCYTAADGVTPASRALDRERDAVSSPMARGRAAGARPVHGPVARFASPSAGIKPPRGCAILNAIALLLGYRRRAIGLIVAAVLLAGCWGWLTLRPVPPPQEPALAGPLVMDLTSYPYLHHEPEGLRLGSALLSHYAYDADTITPGGELVIDLVWGEIAPQQTLQVRLLSLTGHMMDQSIVWAEVNAPIDASQMRLVVPLPPSMPPGVYVPRLGVKQDGKSLPIETVRGSPQSRASLAPVWAPRTVYAPGQGEPLALYGQPHEAASLALLGVETKPIKGDEAEVRLTWRAERAPARNYALSLRRLAANGAEQEAVDLTPMSPDYPTGLWRPGEIVEVRALLPVGRAALADGDAWRVILYDWLTLAEVGRVDLPVVIGD